MEIDVVHLYFPGEPRNYESSGVCLNALRGNLQPKVSFDILFFHTVLSVDMTTPRSGIIQACLGKVCMTGVGELKCVQTSWEGTQSGIESAPLAEKIS